MAPAMSQGLRGSVLFPVQSGLSGFDEERTQIDRVEVVEADVLAVTASENVHTTAY